MRERCTDTWLVVVLNEVNHLDHHAQQIENIRKPNSGDRLNIRLPAMDIAIKRYRPFDSYHCARSASCEFRDQLTEVISISNLESSAPRVDRCRRPDSSHNSDELLKVRFATW